jgi:hypothetical protein
VPHDACLFFSYLVPSHVNYPEEALWQSLGSLPDTHQGAAADNSLLPGFIPSASYIPVYHELDPFFIPEAPPAVARELPEVQSLRALYVIPPRLKISAHSLWAGFKVL